MPLRLSVFLIGFLVLFITALANSQKVEFLFVFFPVEMPVGTIVLFSALVGAVLAVTIYSHIKSYLRFLNSHKELKKGGSQPANPPVPRRKGR